MGEMALLKHISSLLSKSTRYSNAFSSVYNLVLRLYLAKVFFSSGLLKVQNWGNTLHLYDSKYSVPLLPYEMAAYLGTAAELAIPVFLGLGLGARLPAIGLFLFNVVAVYSYPTLWTDSGWCLMKDHLLWGVMCATLFFHGSGKFSLDYLLVRKDT